MFCHPLSLHFTDLFLVDVYRILLSSPAAIAKEIKTRARFLEAILEGAEIKHPLVRRFAQHETPLSDHSYTVLDSSSGPYVGYSVCQRADLQRENRAREPSRRITPTKGISSPGPSSNAILPSFCSADLSCPLCNPYPSPRLPLLTYPGPPSHPQRALPRPLYLYF
jgi:hypothetical protein